MMISMNPPLYIWQQAEWPRLQYSLTKLALPLAAVLRVQGRLYGRLSTLGFHLQEQASLNALAREAVGSSAIEGERLNFESVRSSLARRLGVDAGGAPKLDRRAEGVIEMVMDATTNATAPITLDRLCVWQAALFPTGHSGAVGRLRADSHGPMRVVSGPSYRQKVHYEAPPATKLPHAMADFVSWVETDTGDHPLIKAGLAHLYFLSLHPFEDGNGRIARALTGLLLARADGEGMRFYSVSARFRAVRGKYYDALEAAQKGTLDATEWLLWFLENLHEAMLEADRQLDKVLRKSEAWTRALNAGINERQRKVLTKYLDWDSGGLTARRWASMADTSHDTALRDLLDLVEKGFLEKGGKGGRSTQYFLAKALQVS